MKDLYKEAQLRFNYLNSLPVSTETTARMHEVSLFIVSIQQKLLKGLEFPTTRELAMAWWDNLSKNAKIEIANTQFSDENYLRRWETLTGREIEKVYSSIS